MKNVISLFIVSLFILNINGQNLSIESNDGINISADLYMPHKSNAPFIILFHQAGWSRGEYKEIAPKLNEIGYNCIAIDQRSGGKINGVQNLTNKAAENNQYSTTYVDALPDMITAINYVKENYAKGELILWGSSYSSALVIKIMGDYPEICSAGLAFAPGEYFERLGKSKDYIKDSAKNINKPIFITSAKNEKENWWPIYEVIRVNNKMHFLPTTEGNHGSRALWSKFKDHGDYWNAVKIFLNKI